MQAAVVLIVGVNRSDGKSNTTFSKLYVNIKLCKILLKTLYMSHRLCQISYEFCNINYVQSSR